MCFLPLVDVVQIPSRYDHPNGGTWGACSSTARERVERIDDRGLLVTDHPHFPEIDTKRGQIFGDIANVLVLGSARQDLAADHQERGHRFGVEPYFLAGKIKEIADYCETDVVNTYRVWLKYELFRGRLSESEHRASERSLAHFIAARVNTKVHLNRMVQERSA
jgi:Predicted 3'-5' exonuclease related to the exonuclease domain of PolB